jgi:hypothetical protein
VKPQNKLWKDCSAKTDGISGILIGMLHPGLRNFSATEAFNFLDYL